MSIWPRWKVIYKPNYRSEWNIRGVFATSPFWNFKEAWFVGVTKCWDCHWWVVVPTWEV